MALYKLYYNPGLIIRTSDGLQFPEEDGNWAYEEYKIWRDKGNTADPADPPPPPDQQDISDKALYTDMLSRYQAAIAQLQAVEQDITTITGHAIALSTVVVSGTNAQMQTILRTLGTDMNTLAEDVKTIAVGNEQLLKVVGTYIKSHL